LASFGGKGGEPHLPVEAGLERGDLRRYSIRGTGFVGKLDGFPGLAVATLLEGDFWSAGGHDGKETVSGGEMPRSEGILPWGDGGAGRKSEGR